MAYLRVVQHTLNRNGTYTGGKRNPLHADEKRLTDKRSKKRKGDYDNNNNTCNIFI